MVEPVNRSSLSNKDVDILYLPGVERNNAYHGGSYETDGSSIGLGWHTPPGL
jgi:hypothetical protein